MNKYILLLGVAGVALGSYAAYADNSATMTVTAKIEHDVSLSVEGNTMDFGTIYIDPSNTEGGEIQYNESGEITHQDAYFVSASPVTPMNFTANIPNKTACNSASQYCGGLDLIGGSGAEAYVFGETGNNYCQFYIKYTGAGNNFKIIPNSCVVDNPESVILGDHEATITIEYTPS